MERLRSRPLRPSPRAWKLFLRLMALLLAGSVLLVFR